MNDSSSNSSPLVSVVIVNYNGAEMLRECLKSVFSQSYRSIEVIVVDNDSKDNSIEVTHREFPEVQIIQCEKNLGFAEGNNVGVRAASGEFVVLLNNDATVGDKWLIGLLDAFGHENVAIVTSKVITEGIPSEFYEMNGSINFLGYNIMRQFGDLSKVFYAGGTSMMFKKSIVQEPFLNEYFLYHEDVYSSWRIRLQGYDIRMAPLSLVHHRGNATTKRQTSTLITFYQERNRIINLLLLYQVSTLMKLIPFFVFDVLVKLVNAALSNSRSLPGTLKAYWWLLTNIQWISKQRSKEQETRTIADQDILKLMSSNIIDEARAPKIPRILNVCARFYARLVGLPSHVPENVL
jgi:GT2 family glycosyltransferase